MFYLKLLLMVAGCFSLASCTVHETHKKSHKFSASSTVPPLIHGTTMTINDKDYWDTDDFVPYKEDRQDFFDWKLLKEMLYNEETNIIVSPFSVKLVLTLLSEAAGIESNTAQELNSIYPNLKSKLLIHDFYKNYMNSLHQKSNHYTLNVGTKLFFDNFVVPKQRYCAQIKNFYDADVERINFQDSEESANKINSWVENITEGHIQNIVSKENLQNNVLLIFNAIFFDGLWRQPFNPETIQSPFIKSNNDHVRAEYMTQEDYFYYFDSTKLDAKVIRLPYRGKKFAMTIVMPNSVGGIDKLIEDLNSDELKRVQWLMNEMRIKLKIPKFKFDYTSQLKPVLMTLGINDIFTNNASLPGIDRGMGLSNQLKVSNIVQKSGLVVHERGSTAFSATKVEIVHKFGGDAELSINRPFIFFIEDESTGNMLFFGKVMDPTK